MNTKSTTMMMTLALLAGCSAEMDGPGGGGGGSNDGGNGNDGTPGAYFVESTIRDERGDAITFSADGPVHAHVGETITLGGSDCPTVYKHAYLLDQQAPRYGREQAPNPLVWKLELEDVEKLDLSMSAYRVRTASEQVLLDWTKLPAQEGGLLTIPLHRTGEVSIPLLGEYAGELYIDVRAVDLNGGEQIETACWNHQPLAAPLEIERPRAVRDPGLISTTFTGAGGVAGVAHVINGATTMPTFSARVTQYTSEPVLVSFDVAAPTATYTAKIVDDYVETTRSGAGYNCGPDEPLEPSTDPKCDRTPLPDPTDVSRTGTLAGTRWTATLLDASTGELAQACTLTSDLRVSCQLPPRIADAPARSYRLYVYATGFTDLFPAGTSIDLRSVTGQAYVGTPRAPTARCLLMRVRQAADGSFYRVCYDVAEYARIFALDQSTVTIAPFSVAVQTSPAASLPLADAAMVASDPLTWDTGNADLPGAQ